jgi:hypothetical protein
MTTREHVQPDEHRCRRAEGAVGLLGAAEPRGEVEEHRHRDHLVADADQHRSRHEVAKTRVSVRQEPHRQECDADHQRRAEQASEQRLRPDLLSQPGDARRGGEGDEEEPVEEHDRMQRPPDLLSRSAPGEREGEHEGPDGSQAEPEERRHPEGEDEHDAPVAVLQRSRTGMRRGGGDAEPLSLVLQGARVELVPEGEDRRPDDAERHEPQEEAECDTRFDQHAA